MVVLNLLKNAVDVLQHQPSDKQIWVKLSTTDRHVVLTVEDNGPGIPEQQMPHVFDMFYSTKAEGMGLGLWLSRSILESQDATMTVASSDKGGACFTLTTKLIVQVCNWA
jgi:two-component system C4-dicarboxylate transport sensor histidine kinase DctB